MRPKTDAEIEIMRAGGKLLATILKDLAKKVEPGLTPKDISATAAKQIKNYGLQPVLLGYEGYPDVMCISVNDQVVHGIPGKSPFKNGDVVKLDLTLGYKGLVVDAAITMVAGNEEPPADVKRLINGTKKSLDMAIAAIKGGGTRVGDISAAAQKVLDENHLGIIRDMVGHGVGYGIHEPPNVPNYGMAGRGPVLPVGATIAVEPMATLGDWRIVTARNGWTVLTADGSLGAHFEHTVLVTDKGSEILTLP